ncbi:MAG TPA: hypothetical protein VGL81_36330 [Polyangiaceae bacterium]|jgi:hypothetical protein
MPEATRDDAARARLQGKRAVLVAISIVSVAVIGSSAWQIVPAVFGAGGRPIAAAPPGSSARACAEGIRTLERALGRAVDAAGSASFQARLQPEWSQEEAIREACAQSSEGIDAWAALARLRSAEEQLSPHAGAELEPLRRDVIAHLPADLR